MDTNSRILANIQWTQTQEYWQIFNGHKLKNTGKYSMDTNLANKLSMDLTYKTADKLSKDTQLRKLTNYQWTNI
jgi:hypothetical protein